MWSNAGKGWLRSVKPPEYIELATFLKAAHRAAATLDLPHFRIGADRAAATIPSHRHNREPTLKSVSKAQLQLAGGACGRENGGRVPHRNAVEVIEDDHASSSTPVLGV